MTFLEQITNIVTPQFMMAGSEIFLSIVVTKISRNLIMKSMM